MGTPAMQDVAGMIFEGAMAFLRRQYGTIALLAVVTAVVIGVIVGAKKAKEIWMLCRRYSAQEALDMGLINAVVPHDKLDEEVDRWCEELLAKSPSCLKILKASFRTLYQPLREASRRDWVAEIAPDFYKSGEADEGKNAFLNRREPDFSRFPR